MHICIECRIMYQDCYKTVYRYFTKWSPLPTYFTVPDQSIFIAKLLKYLTALFIIPKFIPYSVVPVIR